MKIFAKIFNIFDAIVKFLKTLPEERLEETMEIIKTLAKQSDEGHNSL